MLGSSYAAVEKTRRSATARRMEISYDPRDNVAEFVDVLIRNRRRWGIRNQRDVQPRRSAAAFRA
jgi:hypothetical protein